MATPEILFAPQALDIVRAAATNRPTPTHDDAVGGLLIGKREGDAIIVLGASEPGPNADDRRLGVALDVTYINAFLEAWFARDPDVDIVGMWHTHPRALDDLTLDDVAAAYTLQEDTGRDIVVALAVDDPANAVRCFHLDAESTQGVGLVPVSYRVEGDAPVVTPVLPPTTSTEVASELQERLSDVSSELREQRSGVTTTSDLPVAIAADVPTPTSTTETQTWTNDETDLELSPARRVETQPVAESSNRRIVMWAIYAVIALLVIFGLIRFFSGGGSAPTGRAPTEATSEVVVQVSAIAEPTATLAPTTAPIVVPTNTVPPTATEAATSTVAPTVAVAETTEATSTAVAGSTATAEVTSDANTEPAVTSVASSRPYVVSWTPMTASERTTFLARARAANCADCYNVDLIGPEPYQELRVRIDGRTGNAALRTFDRPALALVPPRAEPHTLQVYSANNTSVSEPISVTAEEGSFYILRIEAAP